MLDSLVNNRRFFLQVSIWSLIWLLFPFLGWAILGVFPAERIIVNSLIISTCSGLIVALNIGLLVPHFLIKKAYIQYASLVVLTIIGMTLFAHTVFVNLMDGAPFPLGEPPFRPGRMEARVKMFKFIPYLGRAIPLLISITVSSLFEMAVFANQQTRMATALQNEKLDTEMKFLRSQINPHFLFNVLNNIYSLSVLRSETTSENLLKLSNMLRYMLYECNSDKVFLYREVEYIRNLIGLNMLKDSEGMNVRADISDIPKQLMIRPLLFIPFIENAFKHSNIEDLEEGWINLNLQIEGSWVRFELGNSKMSEHQTQDQQGGIGLSNVKRRLELYYPGRYELQFEETPHSFQVRLDIDLHEFEMYRSR